MGSGSSCWWSCRAKKQIQGKTRECLCFPFPSVNASCPFPTSLPFPPYAALKFVLSPFSCLSSFPTCLYWGTLRLVAAPHTP